MLAVLSRAFLEPLFLPSGPGGGPGSRVASPAAWPLRCSDLSHWGLRHEKVRKCSEVQIPAQSHREGKWGAGIHTQLGVVPRTPVLPSTCLEPPLGEPSCQANAKKQHLCLIGV